MHTHTQPEQIYALTTNTNVNKGENKMPLSALYVHRRAQADRVNMKRMQNARRKYSVKVELTALNVYTAK